MLIGSTPHPPKSTKMATLTSDWLTFFTSMQLAERNLTNVLYQVCFLDRSFNKDGHPSLVCGDISFFSATAERNSEKLRGYSTSSTTFLFFMSICQQKWPPGLIDGDIFDFSATFARNLAKLDRKQVHSLI